MTEYERLREQYLRAVRETQDAGMQAASVSRAAVGGVLAGKLSEQARRTLRYVADRQRKSNGYESGERRAVRDG